MRVLLNLCKRVRNASKGPFTAITRVQIPSGTPTKQTTYLTFSTLLPVQIGPISRTSPSLTFFRLEYQSCHFALSVAFDVRHRLSIDVHRYAAIGMPQQFLHSFDVFPVRFENGRKGMTEGMPTDLPCNSSYFKG